MAGGFWGGRLFSSKYAGITVANAVGLILLIWQMNQGDWTKESKFVAISLCIVIAVIGIYNAGSEHNDDRTMLTASLSCISIALMSAIGTLLLH